MKPAHLDKKGFTLIELLVVIGILAVLLVIVLIAINPARQFAQANNTRRRSEVLTILNSIHQYAADNQGNLPGNIASLTAGTAYNIQNGAANADFCAQVMPTYVSALPTDPILNTAAITNCTTYNTGYQITRDTSNRLTISAPSTDTTVTGGVIVSVTR